MEQELIAAAMQDRKAHDLILRTLDLDTELSSTSRAALKYITKFYDKDSAATTVDKTLVVRALRSKAKSNPAMAIIADVVEGIEKVSVPNLVAALINQKKEAAAKEIAGLLASGQYKQAMPWIDKFVQYDKEEGALTDDHTLEVFQGTSTRDLIKQTTGTSNTFKLYPKSLNNAVHGRAGRGHHIGVFALPETGKSRFCINLVYGICNGGQRTLYIGNEDAYTSMLLRFKVRFCRQPLEWVENNPDEADRIANERGWDNLIFASVAHTTIDLIEDLVVKHKPSCLVVDQVRNISIPGKEGLTEILEESGRQMRRLAKQYNLLSVSVTQAADVAEGKLVLSRQHVADSKIGWAASLDLMIGLGTNEDYRQSGRTMISLMGKNKISGEHVYFPVLVDGKLHRLESLES